MPPKKKRRVAAAAVASRPRGAAPKGKVWCYLSGAWVTGARPVRSAARSPAVAGGGGARGLCMRRRCVRARLAARAAAEAAAGDPRSHQQRLIDAAAAEAAAAPPAFAGDGGLGAAARAVDRAAAASVLTALAPRVAEGLVALVMHRWNTMCAARSDDQAWAGPRFRAGLAAAVLAACDDGDAARLAAADAAFAVVSPRLKKGSTWL